MSKRYFKIDTGSYGGEMAVGSVSKEFVDYWKPIIAEEGQGDLIEHLQGIEWDDEEQQDPNSPILEEFYCWNENDDMEHVNGPFADNHFRVIEIELHKDAEYADGMLQWKEGVDHDYSTSMYEEIGEEDTHEYESNIYSRECYTTDSFDSKDEEDYQPTLFFFSSEKGGFGEVYVQTDNKDFDPELLQTGQIESDMGEIIESYWYDRVPLQVDFDYADTTGKGYYASVGYVNTKWHDESDNYVSYDMEETEIVKEAFDCFYEDRE
jgi:hypothetical protein